MNLDSSISDLPKIGPILTNKLKKLGINTVNDLFYHAPSHYLDYSLITTINKIHPDEIVTIHAKIVSITNIFSKRGVRMQIGSVEDDTGKLTVVWFNQMFLTRTLYPGKLVSLSGKVGFFNRKLCLTSPDYEILNSEETETIHTGKLVPVYPETAGLSSKWLRRIILNSFDMVEIEDFLKDKLDLKTAIKFVHFPNNMEEVEKGKDRLGFNEMLFLNLKSLHKKLDWQKNKTLFNLQINKSQINKFIGSLPFTLTDSQVKATDEILKDLQKNIPMNRLLEGDVGSGKTVVAAIGAYATFTNGYQSIIMAPTQILAEQHFKTLQSIFPKLKINLVTSDSKKIDNANIYVGTHALIHSKINFEKVAFVVIDEQHRFGVEQRAHLAKRSNTPHILTMTATPIPRTIALTTYGDLELSVLNEIPKGRQKITTWLVPPEKRNGAYQWANKQIANDKCQMFVVCPLIEESEKETMKDIKSVTTEFNNLKLKIKNLKFGLLHGRLKHAEKEKILDDFRNGKIDILVSTPVVEVGIDIPNATIMLVEAAERFGLAQLHQLRGRVGRGEKKSYCLLFANVHSGNAYKRLKAMEKMHSGFELANLDLELRGPGEIFGTQQSGFAELKFASWNDYELIKETRSKAEEILSNPQKYPLIAEKLKISIA
jgi:ATP-dependent DNA helicase RecG